MVMGLMKHVAASTSPRCGCALKGPAAEQLGNAAKHTMPGWITHCMHLCLPCPLLQRRTKPFNVLEHTTAGSMHEYEPLPVSLETCPAAQVAAASMHCCVARPCSLALAILPWCAVSMYQTVCVRPQSCMHSHHACFTNNAGVW